MKAEVTLNGEKRDHIMIKDVPTGSFFVLLNGGPPGCIGDVFLIPYTIKPDNRQVVLLSDPTRTWSWAGRVGGWEVKLLEAGDVVEMRIKE